MSKGTTHPLYPIYAQMIARCENPKNARYRLYGARGIKVCDAWRASFWQWLADVGPRPEGKDEHGRALWSIDRIETDGDYEPGNVKWSTRSEQSLNKRTYTHMKKRPILLTCKNGLHKMVESNVLKHDGKRRCKACRVIRESNHG